MFCVEVPSCVGEVSNNESKPAGALKYFGGVGRYNDKIWGCGKAGLVPQPIRIAYVKESS